MNDTLRQRFGADALAGVVLLLLISALVWIGVGTGAFALYLAFLPKLGPASAAGTVAGILLAAPLTWVLILNLRAPRPTVIPPEPVRVSQTDTDRAALALLANVAKEKPLLALLFAGLMGAAGVVLKQKA